MTTKAEELLGDQVHVNSLTGCVIWHGDFNRKFFPAINIGGRNQDVRELVYASMTQARLKSNQAIISKCENPCCVREDHFDIATEATEADAIDVEMLAKVDDLYFNQKLRTDVIGETLSLSKFKVNKLVKIAKERRG